MVWGKPQQKKQVEKQSTVQKKVETVDVKQQLDEKKEKLLEIKQKLEQQKTDTAKVEALKKESEQVKKELDAFLSTLNQPERQKYQPEIKELKAMQTEIAKSKEELKDAEKVITEEMKNEKKDKISEQEKWFLEKTWDWVKGNEKEQYRTAKAFGRGALIASWVWIGIYGIGRLFWFWWGDKKKESSSEKKFLDTKFGKALKWLGLWGVAAYLGRWFFTGKNNFFWWFGGGKEKDDKSWPETPPWGNIEKQSKKFESLENAEKKFYNGFWGHVNEYYTNALWDEKGVYGVEDMLGDSKFDQWKEGLVPWVLDNRYSSVSNILSERSFFYEIVGSEGHVMRDKMKKWGLEQVKILIMPILAGIDGLTKNFFIKLNTAKTTGEFIEHLKWNKDIEKNIRTVFRKSMATISYLESRRRELEYTLTFDYLKHHDQKFAKLSEEDQKEAVLEKLEDEERCEKNIDPQIQNNFLWKSLHDATAYLEKNEVLNGNIDSIVQHGLDVVEENRRDLLGVEDDNDNSKITYIKEELEGGKLSPKWKEALWKFCLDWEEEINGFGKKSWYNVYLPIFEMLNLWDDTLEKITATGDYEWVVKSYKEKIGNLLKKSDEGILTKRDLIDLEHQVDDYFRFQKSLVTTQLNMTVVRQKNGSYLVRWWDTIRKSWKQVYRGVQMVIDGNTWEKLQWWAVVAWWFISLDLLTWPARSAMQFSLAKSPSAKGIYHISRFGIKKGLQLTNYITWKIVRNRVPWGLWSIWYDQDSFRISVAKWELNLNRALQIAKRKEWRITWHGNSGTIENKVDLLKSVFEIKNEDEAKRVLNILEEYGDNKYIYRELFIKDYLKKRWKRLKNPKDWFKLRNEYTVFNLNIDKIQQLENISKHIDWLSDTEKVVYKQAMKYAKSIESMEDIVTMWIGDDMIKVLQWDLISPEKYGKYLAKYAGKIDANDMRAFETFIFEAKKAGKITQWQELLFMRNSMRSFDKIKQTGFNITEIDKIKLNAWKRERLASSTKANIAKMTAKLENMAKSARYKPFRWGIKKQISALNEYRKTITPRGMKALADSKMLGNSAFAKLSEGGIHQMWRLSYMLRDADIGKDLLKELKLAKTPEKVKEILGSRGINHADIANDVLLKISNTKSTKKIKDIVNYGAEFKAVKGFKKLIRNPAIRYAGRVFNRVLVGADFVFQAYTFNANMNEANEISKTNKARGERKRDQAYFELASGWFGAVAGGVCLFVPWPGRVVAWVIGATVAVQEVGAKYYEDIEQFKQNKQDFLNKGIAATKQELLTIDSWGSKLSRTWIDHMSNLDSNWLLSIPVAGWTLRGMWAIWENSVEEKKKTQPKTKKEALRALLYMEEMRKNPYSTYDLNSEEVRNNEVLRNQVTDAKDSVDKIVAQRFEYLSKVYLDTNKPLVDKKSFEENKGINQIEKVLQDSLTYSIALEDQNYTGEKTPDVYRQYKLDALKKNTIAYDKLEKLFGSDYRSLFLIYAQQRYYYQLLSEHREEFANSEQLIENAKYFNQYMQYKTLGMDPSNMLDIDFSEEDIDYTRLHHFFESFTLGNTQIEQSETADKGLYLSDEQLRMRYGVTTNLWQNILYAFAKDKLGYQGQNILHASDEKSFDLEKFYHEGAKDKHGIYFDGDNWTLNEDNWSDDEFAKTKELDSIEYIKNMRSYVNSNTNDIFDGKMFTESSEVNKELGFALLAIIDENIALRENQATIKQKILEYIGKNTTNWNYIQLPLDMVLEGTKAGIPWLAGAVFSKQGEKIVHQTTLENYTSPF